MSDLVIVYPENSNDYKAFQKIFVVTGLCIVNLHWCRRFIPLWDTVYINRGVVSSLNWIQSIRDVKLTNRQLWDICTHICHSHKYSEYYVKEILACEITFWKLVKMCKGNMQSLYGKVLTLNLIDCIILMYWPCTVSKCLLAHVTWQGSWNGHETLPENLNKRVTTPLFRVVSTDWGTFYGQITLCNSYCFRFHLSGI